MPVVLSVEEVALLLAHSPSLQYRAAPSLAYSCRLRVSEITNLKVCDIDSTRMLIRVEQRKDCYGTLSPDLLDLLRQCWKGWLFPGREPGQPITTRQMNRACRGGVRSRAPQARFHAHLAAASPRTF